MEFQIAQSGLLTNLPPFSMTEFSFKYFFLANMDIPVDPQELLEWHRAEIARLEANSMLQVEYEKTETAIAKRQ